MPGTLLHLTFAQEVYKQCDLELDKHDFLCGNLIPDETTDKHRSHFRTAYGVTGFFVPVLQNAQKSLLKNSIPLNLGMFCHLYLDYSFITDFLIPEFIWDYKDMKVTNPINKKTWSLNKFLSKEGFYSAYSEINHLLIQNGIVDMELINSLPSILPQTGIPVFDNRRKKDWKSELHEFLSEDTKYIGDILDYDRIMYFIKVTASQFIDEIM